MPPWKNFFLAHSVNDALQVLTNTAICSRVIAGGTDLLLDLQQGRHQHVDTLVDITSISEMTTIEVRKDTLFIGAAVPLNRIIGSPLVQDHAQALIDACRMMAGPQVRNVATLGGNIAHGLPAADGTIALLALNAIVEIAQLDNRHLVPLESLFIGPGQTSINPQGDLLVSIQLPKREDGQASAFNRVMRPQGVALPVLNSALWIQRRAEVINDIRLVIAPSGPIPRRANHLEDVLRGRVFTPDTLALARQTLLSTVHFRSSSQRATSEYRYQLAEILLEDVLTKAWERAGMGIH